MFLLRMDSEHFWESINQHLHKCGLLRMYRCSKSTIHDLSLSLYYCSLPISSPFVSLFAKEGNDLPSQWRISQDLSQESEILDWPRPRPFISCFRHSQTINIYHYVPQINVHGGCEFFSQGELTCQEMKVRNILKDEGQRFEDLHSATWQSRV